VAPPSTVPIAVREAAGRALWARLLSDPPQGSEPDPAESEEREEDDEAA
jgi:hypothetical protein